LIRTCAGTATLSLRPGILLAEPVALPKFHEEHCGGLLSDAV